MKTWEGSLVELDIRASREQVRVKIHVPLLTAVQ
jgi:hypothetical protein